MGSHAGTGRRVGRQTVDLRCSRSEQWRASALRVSRHPFRVVQGLGRIHLTRYPHGPASERCPRQGEGASHNGARMEILGRFSRRQGDSYGSRSASNCFSLHRVSLVGPVCTEFTAKRPPRRPVFSCTRDGFLVPRHPCFSTHGNEIRSPHVVGYHSAGHFRTVFNSVLRSAGNASGGKR